MELRFSDRLRYAAAAALLAVAWGYRRRQRARFPGDSASASKAIPPFRKLDNDDGQQLRAQQVQRIACGDGSDCLKCEVAILGSASGGGMPSISCLLNPEKGYSSDKRNTRMPQSLMVRVSGPESDESFVALVECTQATKRQMCIARGLFGQFQLDAVVVTARDVNKYLGMNDLREVQQASRKDFRNGSGEHLAIYASCSTIETVERAMPFLFSAKEKTKTLVAGLAARGVSQLLGERMPVHSDISVTVRALPCKDEELGFVLGHDVGCVVILPSPHIASEAREWLSERDIQLLVIGNAADQAELSTCAQLVKAVKPRHTVVTGLGCGLDHVTAEDMLQTEVGEHSVIVAYDGMMLETSIKQGDMSRPSLKECSICSSGSTATGDGSASSGGDTATDDDRCIGLSPTHGPVEVDSSPGGKLESRQPTADLTPVSLSELAH